LTNQQLLAEAKAALLDRGQDPLVLDSLRWLCAWKNTQDIINYGDSWDIADDFYEGVMPRKHLPLQDCLDRLFYEIEEQCDDDDQDDFVDSLGELLEEIATAIDRVRATPETKPWLPT
jgi:hypothetical protein